VLLGGPRPCGVWQEYSAGGSTWWSCGGGIYLYMEASRKMSLDAKIRSGQDFIVVVQSSHRCFTFL
jgi:hypothetical protein